MTDELSDEAAARAEFEAWYVASSTPCYSFKRYIDGDYLHFKTARDFNIWREGWRAAKAHQQSAPPSDVDGRHA